LVYKRSFLAENGFFGTPLKTVGNREDLGYIMVESAMFEGKGL
jgi:hypothetical protein